MQELLSVEEYRNTIAIVQTFYLFPGTELARIFIHMCGKVSEFT